MHLTTASVSASRDPDLEAQPDHLQPQILVLHYIPFPGLPKLLLSATRLVKLYLTRIPDSMYFPPEVLVDYLSVLTRLEIFNVGFDELGESFSVRADQTSRYPPPPKRLHLSVLTGLSFRGANEYLEDLVARIDAPLLDTLRIAFFHEPIIDNPQVSQFIGRAPKLKTRDEAVWYSTIGRYRSHCHFHRQMTYHRSSSESHTNKQSCTFRLWRGSPARPSLRISFSR
jgi:hypothetical protein